MASGQTSSGRRKVGVLVMLMGLLTGLFATFAPLVDAAPVNPGTVGGFEIDGNQASPAGGTVDWVDFAGLTPQYDADSLTVLTDAISPDNGLQGSSKENEPEDFTCQAKSPTVTPGKDNLVRAYINTRATDLDSIFLDLAFVRSDGGTQGDSHVNFEFNQNPVTNLCPYTGRSDGDLLITFDFPGNSALPADVQTFSWDADAPDGSDEPGRWIAFTFTGAIAAEDNSVQITDYIVGGTIAARAFGEASIDLVDLAEQSGASSDGCANFGFASVRSRSSGQSFQSALQDIMGGPVDVTTCGKITIHKEDDAGNALEGATFGLWEDGATVPAVINGVRAATGSIDTCTSLADGTCTFDDVTPGDYQVAELTPRTGYDIDPDVVPVSVGFRETVDVAEAFENPRDTGYVDVTKIVSGFGSETFDAAALDGLRFFLTTDPGGAAVNLWPPTDPPESAECSLDGLSLTCSIGPVALGHYLVNEDPTTLPAGLDAGPAVAVNVDEDGEHVAVDYTNETDLPGVSVAKTTSTPTVDAGDGVAFSITLTNDGDVEGSVSFTDDLPDSVIWSIDGTAPTGCVLDESNNLVCTDLVVPASSSVTIDLSGVSDPADCPSITNPTFTITVADEPAELASDNVAEAVTITVNCPDVRVVKTTQTPSVKPGDAVGFDITITNDGPGAAKDVSFTDDLPDGVVWSFVGDAPAGCLLTEANDLSCSFKELADDASVVIHLTGTTDTADCPSITNPVSSVSASNEPSGATENNSTDAVTITVTCPPPPPPPPPPSPIDITIVKDGPTLAHRGDEITYDFTVTNTGDVALVTVVLTDPICDAGTITLVDDGNGDTTLAVDEVWTYECTRVITATDPDPLPNTATVRGTDVQGRTTTDDDDHLVDLIEPAIQIVKTVDDETPGVGQTVTFTYVVTNTGDTALIDVDVVDDQLGPIGTIDVLEPGQSATLTKTMVVAADSPTRNVAVATGEDVLGKTVTDDDDATITVVLGVVITPPAVQPRTLPRTGVDADALLVTSGALLLLGGLLVLSGEGGTVAVRRRRG